LANTRHALGGQRRTQELEVEKLLLPIPEACTALGVGRTMVYELVDQRQIVKVNIGRRSF